MRYAAARYEQQARQHAYRVYVTDTLRCIAENTAKIPYVQGGFIQARWDEIVNGPRQPGPGGRTGAEIAADVIRRAGLVVKTHEPV